MKVGRAKTTEVTAGSRDCDGLQHYGRGAFNYRDQSVKTVDCGQDQFLG